MRDTSRKHVRYVQVLASWPSAAGEDGARVESWPGAPVTEGVSVRRAAEEAARAWDRGLLVHRSADMFPSHALGNLNRMFTEYLQDGDGQVGLLGVGSSDGVLRPASSVCICIRHSCVDVPGPCGAVQLPQGHASWLK